MATRLTTFSKFLITMVIMGLLGFGLWFFLNNTDAGQGVVNKVEETTGQTSSGDNQIASGDDKKSGGLFGGKKNSSSTNDDDVLKVQMFTWGGTAPGLYFNEGAEASEKSRFFKEYGIKVEFVLIDDFDGSRNAWIADEVNIINNEVSAMNTEMERLAPHDPKVFLQMDWSRGGDAVIVKRGINSVNDLRGKTIAYAGFTPSVTFLSYMLESAGMTFADVKLKEVPLPSDAANAFKGGQVDAAIVWSPDDEIAVRETPGSKVLQSTREASNIIADVYMVKNSYLKNNKDKIAAFYEGWMKGAAEINANAGNKAKAAKILAEVTGLPKGDAMGMIGNVRLTNHGDNMNFLGQNTSFKGMTGDKLYTKMGEAFEVLKQAPANRPSWRALAYPQAAVAANLTGASHAAEGAAKFKPVTAADKKKPAISSKPISISFPTGQYKVGENAKTIIDLQFAEIAKVYGNTRIRVEGNTDNVGNKAMNQKLSEQRAQSVAEYLQKQYGMPANRFIIVGNGPNDPVKGCEQNQNDACKSKNRRTEFQLVAE